MTTRDASVDGTRMSKLIPEVLRYGLVSAIALACDYSVLKGLVDLTGWHYQPASAVGFVTGGAVAYVLSIGFVFRSRHMENGALEFGYFLTLGLAGMLVNSAALFVAVGQAGLDLFTAKLLAAVCSFTTNFTLRRQVLFWTSEVS
jgi:putative flippase GtrA